MQPEFTGNNLQSSGARMSVSLDSPIPTGSVFQANRAGRVLLGEVVACRESAGRWEASLLIHSPIAEENAGMDVNGPETVLPDLLALNTQLLDACAPAAGSRGARVRQS